METRHPEFVSAPIAPDAFAMEYNKVRDRLPQHVRKPLDVSRDEVLEICKAHGVDHPTKLGREGAQPTLQTLERVARLLEDIAYIFERKEIPPGYKDWEVEIPEGDEFTEAVEKDGKVFFSTVDKSCEFSRIFDSSGLVKNYDQGWMARGDLNIVNGKPACVINDVSKSFVFFDGKRIGPPEGYKSVRLIRTEHRKLIYTAKNHESDKDIIYVDGEPYGSSEGYLEVSHVIPVGEELAIAVKERSGGNMAIYLGDRLIAGDKEGYESVREMKVINGDLAFIAKDTVGRFVIVYDGVVQKMSNQDFFHLKEIDGQPFWVEKKAKGGDELFVDGESYGMYSDFLRILETNKGMVIVVTKAENPKRLFLLQEGRSIGKEEGYLRMPSPRMISVGDEVIIASCQEPGSSWVIESTSGAHFYSCEKCHLLKAIDDTHFIVIAEEDGKVVQRTFDIEHLPYQGEVNT
ncbi:TPA: hypothetical protein DEP34_00830 [Candidatus Uhrbacteria bacterium]|uniref:Uncharacterized protein n=2 Tax=Candidatus Uhriibacteriota TaxID=1752732 RepID=A0A0G1SID6_9BACT|nr:MAG: hypothetical protein UX45_C0002G0068 [Candidatus Uhrbacteria bacterium GW2011_GWF2_46_218]KKU41843.1 MAG: hypothetical protein UX57_C0001G0067 [Candidatus Uhrbacteria bacterium GW2011_GWE2_46_68]HBK34108.1 hypothetical protein [Candidatus Uhrbacteria bacterium]HCB18915.1 hypothetical protein [Candidatus Uhrbacteria bacterium]